VRSVHRSAAGSAMRWSTWMMPPSNTRYSAHAPGKSFVAASGDVPYAEVAATWTTRLRWVWPAA
jgi:hypothetical protein